LITVTEIVPPEPASPLVPIFIPPAPIFLAAQSFTMDVGLGAGEIIGLEVPGVVGLRKFEAGVLIVLL
jgi:hypothetical protein